MRTSARPASTSAAAATRKKESDFVAGCCAACAGGNHFLCRSSVGPGAHLAVRWHPRRGRPERVGTARVRGCDDEEGEGRRERERQRQGRAEMAHSRAHDPTRGQVRERRV